jgi:orotate phosphoribosyltransferase
MSSVSDPAASREQQLAQLGQDLVQVAYLRGQFVLRSGATSNYYFDKYRFETRPQVLRRLATCLAALVPAGTDRLAGPELGGVALATAVSLEMNLPFVIVRTSQKTYATTSQIEGELQPGERVAVIEDIVTSGGAALLAVSTLRQAGAVVEDVIAVIDREEGAAESFVAQEVRFQPLFRRSQLGV